MRHRLGSAVTTVAVLAVVVALALVHAREVGDALAAVPLWAVLMTVGLHLATLALRSEAWRLTLASVSGVPLPRRDVHGANGVAFVAGALQSHAALPVRVALLRRLAGDRAPRPGQIWPARACCPSTSPIGRYCGASPYSPTGAGAELCWRLWRQSPG